MLPLHLALGVASYGLFAAAVVHAWLMGRAEKNMRMGADTHVGLPLLTLERLTFRFVTAGFALLTATLLAGWVFGDLLYGAQAAWRWDHKTVFSLLSWFTFALLLVGRWRFGWRDDHGFAADRGAIQYGAPAAGRVATTLGGLWHDQKRLRRASRRKETDHGRHLRHGLQPGPAFPVL